MYDRVRFWLLGLHVVPGVVFTRVVNRHGVRRREADLGSMKVTLWPWGLCVEGSLAKYYRKDNIKPFTLSMVHAALEQLEAQLGIPIRHGDVTRLEFGQTLVMSYPVPRYLALWGHVPRFAKQTFSNKSTVQYLNRTWSFQGYDKGLQARREGTANPFSDCHLLRPELKIKGHLKRFLGHGLTVGELGDHERFTFLVSRWEDFAINRIPKIRKPRPYVDAGVKEMREKLAAYGLCAMGGLEPLLMDIGSRGDLSPSQRSKMRAVLLDLAQESKWTDPNELSVEFDLKVRQAAISAFS